MVNARHDQARLVMLGRSAATYQQLLGESLQTPWRIDCWVPGDAPEALQEALQSADAVVIGADAHTHAGFSLLPYRLHMHPRLRLVQMAFSSHDWLRSEMLPEHAFAANVQAHAITIAEYAMAAMLTWEIGIARMDGAMRQGDWRHSGALFGEPHGELHGKTLGLLGYGSIGVEVAKRAAAFGMRIVAMARSARDAPAPLAWLGGPERLGELLRISDHLVVACDLNEGTRGMLDAARLASMKRNAFVISVTRAQIFDEKALYEALRARTIGGAALDVWFRYPASLEDARNNGRPSELPFHELDNILMTPHAASWTVAHHERRWRLVAANLDRIARGEEPDNILLRPRLVT